MKKNSETLKKKLGCNLSEDCATAIMSDIVFQIY